MGKLYTLDEKLLIGGPEIRIGSKVYPVDDRQKTVKKLMKVDRSDVDAVDGAFKLAFGNKAANEIDAMDLPFNAYISLFELVIAAMTGEEPEEVEARFQEVKSKQGNLV